MAKRVRQLLFVAGLCAIGLGCTKNPNAPAQVSGTVKYKGQIVKGGNVQFHSNDSGIVTAPIGPDGKYQATDVPAGEMTVTVETDSAKPVKPKEYKGPKGAKQPEYKPPGAPENAGAGPDPANYVQIPAKYKDSKTSGLTTTLSKGKNTYDIDLTD